MTFCTQLSEKLPLTADGNKHRFSDITQRVRGGDAETLSPTQEVRINSLALGFNEPAPWKRKQMSVRARRDGRHQEGWTTNSLKKKIRSKLT